MNLIDSVRQLAKSNNWQRIYNSSKELSGINLFNNITNFSGIQIIFLYYLEMYNILYKELAQKDWENLDDAVIKDNVRCDAFLYWRTKQQERELYQIKQNERELRVNHKKTSKASGQKKSLPIYSGKKRK